MEGWRVNEDKHDADNEDNDDYIYIYISAIINHH